MSLFCPVILLNKPEGVIIKGEVYITLEVGKYAQRSYCVVECVWIWEFVKGDRIYVEDKQKIIATA